RNSTRARTTGGVRDQAGNAAAAARTAASTSAALANGTCRARVPVAGSNTSPVRLPSPGTARPPIQCESRAGASGPGGRLGACSARTARVLPGWRPVGERLPGLHVVVPRRLANQNVDVLDRRVDGLVHHAGDGLCERPLLLGRAALANVALNDGHLRRLLS